MGKRELFIVVGFVLAGILAYQLTVAPAKAGEGFSFARMWNSAHRGMIANRATGSFARTGHIAPSAAVDQLRIAASGVSRLRVVGEARADIEYVLQVESTGPDPAAARGYAKDTALKQDDLGRILALRVSYPSDGRQTSTLVLKIPSRLGVRVEGGIGLDVSNVGSVQLDSLLGDTTVTGIAGGVTGSHRNGDLTVTGADFVKMTLLNGSRASFEAITPHGLTLDVRNGECQVAKSAGPLELDEVNEEIAIASYAGPVRISGTGGRVTLDAPRAEAHIDTRRAEVEVTLRSAVPLTLLTTDDTLRLLLDGPPKVTVDAVASDGQVQANDFNLSADQGDKESRLVHAFGDSAAPRVSLRDLRGDIVIRKSAGIQPAHRGRQGT
jgi:hypothetical protein